MRSMHLVVPLTLLLLLASARAEETPKDALLEAALLGAALRSPMPLSEIVATTHTGSRRPLRAAFLLDTENQLVARLLLTATGEEAHAFEEWTGPVGDGGWIPRRRILSDEEEIAEATRLRALHDAAPAALRDALGGAARTETQPQRPADVVLAATLVEGAGGAIALRTGIDGEVRGFVYTAAAATYAPLAVGAAPERPAHEVRALPALEVPRGAWFNVESPPTLAGWRGHPVLVLVIDPG